MNLRNGLGVGVVAALIVLAMVTLTACGGNDDEGVTVEDFEGSWEATSFVVTSKDASMTIDLVALGGNFILEVDDSGNGEGALTLPQAQGGATLPFSGSVDIIDQETIQVAFDQEIPPLLTSFAGPFTLEGDTLTVTDENFKFDFGGGEVAVTGTFVLVRR